MKSDFRLIVSVLTLCSAGSSGAVLLMNGNLDRTHAVEIVPGLFLPKPDFWINEGVRSTTGPYEDEMSSEPWAGPAPTPVTTDGNFNPPPPDGFDGPDGGVFFKAFSGSATNVATGHLYQDVAAIPGFSYTLTGWAGAEPNYLADESVFVLEFLGTGGSVISSVTLDLVAAGLFTPNGQPFNYKEYSLSGIAPAGATTVRSRVSMIGGRSNPAGGGQAFVVDDFALVAVPEPSGAALALVGVAGLLSRRSRQVKF